MSLKFHICFRIKSPIITADTTQPSQIRVSLYIQDLLKMSWIRVLLDPPHIHRKISNNKRWVIHFKLSNRKVNLLLKNSLVHRLSRTNNILILSSQNKFRNQQGYIHRILWNKYSLNPWSIIKMNSNVIAIWMKINLIQIKIKFLIKWIWV